MWWGTVGFPCWIFALNTKTCPFWGNSESCGLSTLRNGWIWMNRPWCNSWWTRMRKNNCWPRTLRHGKLQVWKLRNAWSLNISSMFQWYQMKYQWEKSFKYRVYTYRCPTSWAAMMTPLKLVEASPIPKLKALPRNNGADRQAPLTYATPTVTKMCYFSIRYPSIINHSYVHVFRFKYHSRMFMYMYYTYIFFEWCLYPLFLWHIRLSLYLRPLMKWASLA